MKVSTGFPAIAAVLAGLVATDASAFSYVMPDDGTLLSQADGVVVATVTSAPVAGSDKSGLPHLRYRLSVERTLAGRAKHSLDLELPGTLPAAKVRMFVPGIPTLAEGDRVLVFYNEDASGIATPEQATLGLFFETSVGKGVRAYDRRLEDTANLGDGFNDHYALKRDAGGFEAWIEASGRGMKLVEDYLIVDEAVAKYVVAPSGFADQRPARWFTFAQGQTVNWVSTSGGLSGGSFNAVSVAQQALAAWTNDAGSNISFAHTGTVASDATASTATNGVNTLVWNDPQGAISGSYNCANGGTLAIGGSFASSNLQTFNGQSYHPMVESFVIVQDGVACVFNDGGGSNAAETLTHEFGHTLGLGHSEIDDATMRSYIHRDGRGASLRQDDRNAVAFLYPAQGGGSAPRIHRNGFE